MTGLKSLTEQLQEFLGGDRSGTDALMNEIFPKLRQIARRELKGEWHKAALRPTELIRELWLRDLAKADWQIRNRGHFYAIASLVMRRIVVNMARERLAQRRGGTTEILSLEDSPAHLSQEADALEVIEIGQMLERLDDRDSDAARVIDMHYFAGFTLKEIAESSQISVRQVRLRWERGLKSLRNSLKVRGAAGGR